MLTWALEGVAWWGPWMAALAAPFLLSSGALLRQQVREPRRRRGGLPIPAEQWLRDRIAALGVDVSVQVHRMEGLDAYWPGVGTIGLCDRTAGGRGVHHWSVAAHELGHALNERAHPLMPHLLPGARLVSDVCWRLFGAALVTGALLGLDELLVVGLIALLGAIGAGAVVLWDEATASRRGVTLLSEDPRLSPAGLREAEDGMADALAVYGADLVGRLVVLLMWPALWQRVQGSGPVEVVAEPWAPGVWLLVVVAPVLALRAVHVLLQVVRPEPVGSEFRLFTVMQTEAQWELLGGLGVLALIGSLYDHAGGAAFAVAVTLAATVALGPVASVGRALGLLPLLWWLRRRGREDDDRALFPEARPDGAPPALLALYGDPPWYVRASWLTHLAWIPMVTLLLAHLLA